jgi:hypothetical protein
VATGTQTPANGKTEPKQGFQGDTSSVVLRSVCRQFTLNVS